MRAQAWVASVALGATVIVGACKSGPPPTTSAAGATNAQRVDVNSAADQYARAMCKHADQCGEIGGNRTYATRNACVSEKLGKAENDLRVTDCPHGVDTTRLNACLAEIAAEACTGVGSGFARSASCATGTLCP
jgi:hypothetical protein